MSNGIITECVYFDSVEGITDDEFITIVEGLESGFHALQPGFIDTELVRGKGPRQWLMIQHWESMSRAVDASRGLMGDPAAEIFRNSLDPKTVRISYLEYVRRWKK